MYHVPEKPYSSPSMVSLLCEKYLRYPRRPLLFINEYFPFRLILYNLLTFSLIVLYKAEKYYYKQKLEASFLCMSGYMTKFKFKVSNFNKWGLAQKLQTSTNDFWLRSLKHSQMTFGSEVSKKDSFIKYHIGELNRYLQFFQLDPVFSGFSAYW